MIATKSTDTLQVKLAATPSANPYFFGAYTDAVPGTGITADESIPPTQLNGSTLVSVYAAPAAGTTRHLGQFGLTNTAAAQITLSIVANGTPVLSYTLDVGDMLEYDRHGGGGFRVRAANGAAKLPAAGVQHTPFGPDTATVAGVLTLPAGYQTLKVTGAEDFLGMSPGSLQPGDICYLSHASGRIVRNGGAVSAPAVPFSMVNGDGNGDLTAPAGAQLTWQLGPGGTSWILKGAV